MSSAIQPQHGRAVIERTATISPCGTYRYDLTRRWGDGPTALWVMLNPSTADATEDDPTIRRCIGFSKREGCGRLAVVNLYAYRATDPKALLTAENPIGPDNLATVRRWLMDASLVVAAWGAWPLTNHRIAPARLHVEGLATMHGHDVKCLGTTKAGAPRHPLYVRGDQPFVSYAEQAQNGSPERPADPSVNGREIQP